MAKMFLYFNVTNVIIFILICNGFQALASLDCNFEDDICGWQQDQSDGFDWRRKSGRTPTPSTGPNSDHTTGEDGHYIYIEASLRTEGDKAILSSPVQETGPYCLTFWYNMHGNDIGVLNVYMILNGGSKTLILKKDESLGNNDWRKAVINNHANDKYQITFEGVIGDGIKGDIAVDDISIIPRPCSVDCDYDNGLCNWMQADDDDFDWTLKRGPTETSDTGPEADQSSGNGQYVYIDSSGKSRNDIAWLMSPLQNAGKYCFSFWYNMYGDDVDKLRVEQLYPNGTTKNIFTQTGNKGRKWILENILLHSTAYFKIIFEGKVKNRYSEWFRDNGDIAIDDVRMLSCQDCDDPTPEHAVANTTNFEYGSVLEIKCNLGYHLKGNSSIVCQPGGSWSAPQPTCIPFDCGDSIIPNGKFIALGGTTFGQTATHVCNTGYNLVGDATVSCTATGWNSTTTTCKIVDCGNRTIPNGKFIAIGGTTFGQSATHVCNIGYILVGDATVSCTATGWNSSTATCEIVDCGNRTIPNGKFIAMGGTTFRQTASQVCYKGYTLIGDKHVTCTSTGWNGAVTTCTIVDCGNPTPKYATANSTNFKYGSRVLITCNKGYNLTGQSHIVCLANGSWSTRRPTCKPYDCRNRTISNGRFDAPKGTTFGQTATHVCSMGYRLVGDTYVTCTVSGWKGAAASCESVGAENDALIAVYVVVSVIVVVLAVLFTVIFLRRIRPKCKKMSEDKHESRKNPIKSFPNKTYTGLALENQNQTNYSYIDAAVEVDNEYAIITDDDQNKNKDISDTVYYNMVGDAVTLENDGSHNYDHTKNTAAHFVDESYSHILDNNTDTTFEPSYNTTLDLDSENSPSRKQVQSDINSYDMLNVNNCNKATKHRKEIEESTESDYDHAHAGGTDPVSLNENDYSHLNDENVKRKYLEPLVRGNQDKVEYSNINENIREKVKTVENPKAGYEQPIGHKPQYFALDTENQDKIEDDRHYFVLEAEEACDENHDYFVLEKT